MDLTGRTIMIEGDEYALNRTSLLNSRGFGEVFDLDGTRGIPEGTYLRLGENHWYQEIHADFTKVTNTNVLIALKSEYELALDEVHK